MTHRAPFERHHAIVIGVGEPAEWELWKTRDRETFQSKVGPPLAGPGPVANATRFAEVLEGNGFGNRFPVRRILGPKATKEKVMRSLDDFAANEGRGAEVLVFYWSGHGLHVRNGGCHLVTANVNPGVTAGYCVSLNEVIDIIRRCEFEHALLVVDACHSVPPDGADIWQATDRENHHSMTVLGSWALTPNIVDSVMPHIEPGGALTNCAIRVLEGRSRHVTSTGPRLTIREFVHATEMEVKDLRARLKTSVAPEVAPLLDSWQLFVQRSDVGQEAPIAFRLAQLACAFVESHPTDRYLLNVLCTRIVRNEGQWRDQANLLRERRTPPRSNPPSNDDIARLICCAAIDGDELEDLIAALGARMKSFLDGVKFEDLEPHAAMLRLLLRHYYHAGEVSSSEEKLLCQQLAELCHDMSERPRASRKIAALVQMVASQNAVNFHLAIRARDPSGNPVNGVIVERGSLLLRDQTAKARFRTRVDGQEHAWIPLIRWTFDSEIERESSPLAGLLVSLPEGLARGSPLVVGVVRKPSEDLLLQVWGNDEKAWASCVVPSERLHGPSGLLDRPDPFDSSGPSDQLDANDLLRQCLRLMESSGLDPVYREKLERDVSDMVHAIVMRNRRGFDAAVAVLVDDWRRMRTAGYLMLLLAAAQERGETESVARIELLLQNALERHYQIEEWREKLKDLMASPETLTDATKGILTMARTADRLLAVLEQGAPESEVLSHLRELSTALHVGSVEPELVTLVAEVDAALERMTLRAAASADSRESSREWYAELVQSSERWFRTLWSFTRGDRRFYSLRDESMESVSHLFREHEKRSLPDDMPVSMARILLHRVMKLDYDRATSPSNMLYSKTFLVRRADVARSAQTAGSSRQSDALDPYDAASLSEAIFFATGPAQRILGRSIFKKVPKAIEKVLELNIVARALAAQGEKALEDQNLLLQDAQSAARSQPPSPVTGPDWPDEYLLEWDPEPDEAAGDSQLGIVTPSA